jgi:predicted AAA+ superfamily ATPase
MFLFEKAAPWIRSDYDRVSRRPKIFAADTGLMASALDWDAEEVFLNPDRSGKLIETFVFQELAAQVDLDSSLNLYQYRDREKREIDFIIEKEHSAILGIEVKASHGVDKNDFKHLRWFSENITAKESFIGLVLYAGEHVLPYGENMLAVPIAALWL